MSLAECVSAKLLLDPRQLHDVTQSVSQSNHCSIYVSRIVLLAVLSDLCQPHSVIHRMLLDLYQPHASGKSFHAYPCLAALG